MRRERIAADQALFAERIAGRAQGLRRSRRRAEALAPILGIDLGAWRRRAGDVITVVGSKGKGTAATHASAVLAAAGLRVGTLTSPGLRSNRERIRVAGVAIARREYEPLVSGVARRAAEVASMLPDDGYLAPSGLFTLAALRHFEAADCEVVVLEAGMGGAADEVSLVDAAVVVVGAILAEHLGTIGDTVWEVAEEKLGVVSSATEVIITVAQKDPEVARLIAATAGDRHCRLEVVDGEFGGLYPAPGLGAANAQAGAAAGRALLDLRGTGVDAGVLAAVEATVRLPGRLTGHQRGSQAWLIDAATNPAAIRAAIEHSARVFGTPTAVLLFVPYHRDAAPLLEALRGQHVVRVRAAPPAPEPGAGAVMHLEEIDLDGLGPRVLALGPAYFVGELLALFEVDCERSFELPPAPRA